MLLEITKQLHELNGEVPLFGMVLFTERHPFVVKCLKDPDYFSALGSLSGDQMAIFATGLPPGSYKSPEMRPGTIGMMCMVWHEPRANLEILGWFGLKDSQELPLFVVFSIEEGDLLSECHAIKNNSAEDVFKSLEAVLKLVNISVDRLGKDSPKLFADIRKRMRRVRLAGGVKRVFDVLGMLRGATGL